MTAHVPMIDVSSNNHPADQPIEWARVRAYGIGAVMIKATESVDYVNPWLSRDAAGAAAAGIKVGYYHFAHPAAAPAPDQAAYALAAIKDHPRDLGLALDLEVTEGLDWPALAEWAQAFHAAVLRSIPHSPLYVNDSFLASLPGAPWGMRLWLAQSARPRQQVWAWQTTAPAAVNGIAAPTDIGYLHPAG